jgi:2-oxoglutarate ferredoxin oxidoreductase subunit delta
MRNLENHISKISTPYIWANTHRSEACWKCIDSCPKQVIGKVGFLMHKHVVIQNRDNCVGCKKCIKACSRGVFFQTNLSNESDIIELKGNRKDENFFVVS